MKTNFVNNAINTAKRAAFLLSLVLVAIISISCVIVCAPLSLMLCDALGITGTMRFVIPILFMFGPVLELVINVEYNLLAVVDRIFSGFFPCRMPFECFSFWRRMLYA